MLCTTTYELRRRGYDVHAGLSKTGYMPDDLFGKIYKNYTGTTKIQSSLNTSDTYANIQKTLSGMGDGARGNFIVWWKHGGGHSVIWENKDGTTVFKDGQTGVVYEKFSEQILPHVNRMKPMEFLRTDNLSFDFEALKKYSFIDTSTKTQYYVEHGREITVSILSDPAVQAAGIAAGYAAVSANEKKSTNSANTKKR